MQQQTVRVEVADTPAVLYPPKPSSPPNGRTDLTFRVTSYLAVDLVVDAEETTRGTGRVGRQTQQERQYLLVSYKEIKFTRTTFWPNHFRLTVTR